MELESQWINFFEQKLPYVGDIKSTDCEQNIVKTSQKLIMTDVRALQPLAGEESTRFGGGLRFNYNSDTGVLVSGGMQWQF